MTETDLLKRISINPQICSGVPCIKGHRIMVYQILGLLGSGLSPQEICSEKWFPTLEVADIYACVVFANQLVRNEEIHFSEELATGSRQSMKLLLDECVSGSTRIFLREAGHEPVTVKELGRVSAPNGEILTLANAQQCVLVTVDRGLGDIRIYPLGTHYGIIVLKLLTPEETDAVHGQLRKALAETPADHLKGSLLIVDRAKFRLRRTA